MFRVHIKGDLRFRSRNVDLPLKDRGYVLSNKIQSGSFGTVYKITRIVDNLDFVLKVISKESRHKTILDIRTEVLSEINIMNQLIHPNILNIIDFYESRNHFNIISELCSGGESFDAILKSEHGLSREHVRSIAADTLQAIRYCHEQRIMHRDIKPENILLTRPYVKGMKFPPVKLIDFGLATYFRPGIPTRGRVGTRMYMAPEVFYNRFYDEKVDLFSIGCVIYTCLSGVLPFQVADKNSRTGFKTVRNKIYSKGNQLGQDDSIYVGNVWKDLNLEKQFLNTLLDTDPAYRSNAIQALRHPYFEESLSNKPMPTSNEILHKLRGLYQEDKLKRVIKYLIGRDLLPSDKSVIERWFGEKDSMEIEDAVQHLGAYFQFLSEEELKYIAASLDLNGDGKIDKDEFVSTVMPTYLYDTVLRIHQAFSKLDTDKNNRLSFEEVERALFGDKEETQKVWDALDIGYDEEMSMRMFDYYLEKGGWSILKPEEDNTSNDNDEEEEEEAGSSHEDVSIDEDEDIDDGASIPKSKGMRCCVQ